MFCKAPELGFQGMNYCECGGRTPLIIERKRVLTPRTVLWVIQESRSMLAAEMGSRFPDPRGDAGKGEIWKSHNSGSPRDGGAWWAAVYGVAQSDTTEVT